ncbi:S8 family serine peptidase [Sphingomonas sp. 1185]|uniref:S8 family serine peptidase n=1 Tax=Sphingomonas sp. 1185 TaxID=3156411 RepID=UPI00339B14DB
MARFVIANRRAGRFTADAKAASRFSVAVALDGISSARIVEDNEPDDPLARRVVVVEADPVEVERERAAAGPDTIIEPEILHHPLTVLPNDLASAVPFGAATAAIGNVTRIVVTGGGAALASCQVTVFFRGFGGTSNAEAVTDAQGQCNVPNPAGAVVAGVLALPNGGFWPTLSRGAATAIDCAQLPADGPLGWWHAATGIAAFDPGLGSGVRVGVIDTGLGPHRCLRHAHGIGSFIDGIEDSQPGASDDVQGHGTHVAGTIGARPVAAGQYGGIAPGVDLFAARVFAPGKLASNADIANAIDALSRGHAVDLINMSLGAATPSEVIHDAILDAAERGTLCIVAAGNDDGPVNYPAAFPECVAVSALGLAGWAPPTSLSATRLPQAADCFGRDNLFLANFSCFGPEIDCAAPGVGIIAPIPDLVGDSDTLYAAMDGTSMASPVACGIAAALLSQYPGIAALPRDASRAALCRSLLTSGLQDIGLAPKYQGRGIAFMP